VLLGSGVTDPEEEDAENPPTGVPAVDDCEGVHCWLDMLMHGGNETELLRAICCPTTTDCVPLMLFPPSLIVGVGAAGRATFIPNCPLDVPDPPSPPPKLIQMLCAPTVASQVTE